MTKLPEQSKDHYAKKKPTNIYLDIDGVLITKDMQAANYVDKFIAYIFHNYPERVYWLSTRCQGDADKTVAGISHLFDEKTVNLLRQIKPTVWLGSPLKTSAIDFSQPFLWFDDYPLNADKQVLKNRGVLDNWIEVDLVKNPHQLNRYITSFPLPVGYWL